MSKENGKGVPLDEVDELIRIDAEVLRQGEMSLAQLDPGLKVDGLTNENGFRICGYIKDDGKPCSSRFVKQEPTEEELENYEDVCTAHRPGYEDQMQERRKKAAKTRWKNAHENEGLMPDELPPLETHEDAKMWLEAIGRAVATGRLEDRSAQAAIRAVSEWVKTEGERATREVIDDLKDEIEQLRDKLQEQKETPW